MPHSKHVTPQVSPGAMADIAFLLLTFYMVTTEIKEYKGLSLLLPKSELTEAVVLKNDRNIFSIHINSDDEFMVEGEKLKSLNGIRETIKRFILNYKKEPNLSDSPTDAVVSIKSDRGTSYRAFIEALDEAQAAYYDIYAERAGITPLQFRKLKPRIPAEREVYEKGRKGIPMNISIAESN